jgi:hypothetical protein
VVVNQHQEEIQAVVQLEQMVHLIADQSMVKGVEPVELQDQTSSFPADHSEVAAEQTPQGLQVHTRQLFRHQVLVVVQETLLKGELKVLH